MTIINPRKRILAESEIWTFCSHVLYAISWAMCMAMGARFWRRATLNFSWQLQAYIEFTIDSVYFLLQISSRDWKSVMHWAFLKYLFVWKFHLSGHVAHDQTAPYVQSDLNLCANKKIRLLRNRKNLIKRAESFPTRGPWWSFIAHLSTKKYRLTMKVNTK